MAQFKVHNLIIVDASGSMTSIYEQALAGINETLSTIREEAKKSDKIEQSVTVLSFASGGEPLQYAYRNTIAEQTSPLTPNDYTLRGMTALYDAIGTSVTDLERNKGKEDKVLVTIITDGYENDSIEWDGASVKKLIDRLCKKGWVFTYIGANQDAALEAGKIGVKNSLTFEASIEGTVNMSLSRSSRAKDGTSECASMKTTFRMTTSPTTTNDNRKGWIPIGIQPFLIQSSVPDYLTILTVLMPPSATTLTK